MSDVDIRDCWRTPPELFDRLDREFRFVCDVAASKDNRLCDHWIGPNQNALAVDWPTTGWCFLNPPFSQIPRFLAKVWEQLSRGVRVVVIVPGHRHEQAWFHEWVIGRASEIIIPRGRVQYRAPGGIKTSSVPFPSMALVYCSQGCAGTLVRGLLGD